MIQAIFTAAVAILLSVGAASAMGNPHAQPSGGDPGIQVVSCTGDCDVGNYNEEKGRSVGHALAKGETQTVTLESEPSTLTVKRGGDRGISGPLLIQGADQLCSYALPNGDRPVTAEIGLVEGCGDTFSLTNLDTGSPDSVHVYFMEGQ